MRDSLSVARVPESSTNIIIRAVATLYSKAAPAVECFKLKMPHIPAAGRVVGGGMSYKSPPPALLGSLSFLQEILHSPANIYEVISKRVLQAGLVVVAVKIIE